MLSLLPINDPIRDVLDVHVRHFSQLINLATITVAVGVALEGIEITHDCIALIRRKRREKRERANIKDIAEVFPVGNVSKAPESDSGEPRWVKRVLRVGLILVVVGVVGEWRCGAKLEDAHDAVHQYDIGKILEADQNAGGAAASAKTARTEADEAKTSAKTAGELAQSADTDARNARRETARLKKDNAQLANDLLSATNQLNALDAKRGELEESLAPRPELGIGPAKSGAGRNIDPLTQFSGMNVILEYLPGTEADALSLEWVVTSAGWHITRQGYSPFDAGHLLFRANDGVSIWRSTAGDDMGGDQQSTFAAKALCEFLQDSGWDAKSAPGSPTTVSPIYAPSGSVLVQIKHRPTPYFTSTPQEVKRKIAELEKDERRRGIHSGCNAW